MLFPLNSFLFFFFLINGRMQKFQAAFPISALGDVQSSIPWGPRASKRDVIWHPYTTLHTRLNPAGLCERIESPSRERIYSHYFSLHILLSEDSKSAIGFAETTLTMSKEFRDKVDEGKSLASLKQLAATTGRDWTALVSEGAKQCLCLNHISFLRQGQEVGWVSRAQAKSHGNFLLLW